MVARVWLTQFGFVTLTSLRLGNYGQGCCELGGVLMDV